MKPLTFRCEEASVLLIARGYDEQGQLCAEKVIGAPIEGGVQPLKVFRGETPDVWAMADEALAKAIQTPEGPTKK